MTSRRKGTGARGRGGAARGGGSTEEMTEPNLDFDVDSFRIELQDGTKVEPRPVQKEALTIALSQTDPQKDNYPGMSNYTAYKYNEFGRATYKVPVSDRGFLNVKIVGGSSRPGEKPGIYIQERKRNGDFLKVVSMKYE